ncbi:16S rRNA (adenine(1518)-N(6)/adenine(1519)-N(6))-dimethyltransferase RsmA [Kangiella sp. TOML190]|uniref:16S rRNA (adenine(1518)-N(6)/adenine(1519)-N(6))- dimethyltransferase RsmA n=1 Tax=Kangiella sp. TOML190 TaxID=2931351 RepID=UPI0020420AC3|nr:16S rRNA (adenine(1518)-N(6)/adenine(1519)-N(6))-dimethyltransferase RsmA [Kangiella sp. TOML190]
MSKDPNRHSQRSKLVKGHQARKRFGQNFLSDPFYIQRIVDAIAPTKQDSMVEIGPGLGAITELLVDQVEGLHVVELDNDLIPRLEASFGSRNNFHIHHADALKFDFGQLATTKSEAKLRIVGNLPYNISTPLIFHLLQYNHLIEDMYFMLQKEVVQRICAPVSTNHYGRLSVMSQYYCQTQMLFEVPPGAFQPAPKVDSAIVRLVPRPASELLVVQPQQLKQLVITAFNQRRKTIRNNLKQWFSDEALAQQGVDPKLRPENIELASYIKLANALSNGQL